MQNIEHSIQKVQFLQLEVAREVQYDLIIPILIAARALEQAEIALNYDGEECVWQYVKKLPESFRECKKMLVLIVELLNVGNSLDQQVLEELTDCVQHFRNIRPRVIFQGHQLIAWD